MNKERFEELRVPGAIRWEDACVIHDTILEHKPRIVLELGCFMGLSTLVILDALKENGFQYRFYSLDIKPMGAIFNFKDQKRVRRSELVPEDALVNHLTKDALKYLKGLFPEMVDLIFEDIMRQTEYTKKLIPEILRVLRPDGIALFHDLKLEAVNQAFIDLKLMDNLKLFPPSWMGMLRKENGVLV